VLGVRDAGEVLPREGWPCHPRVGDHARVVLPNQEALDAINMACIASSAHDRPVTARVITKIVSLKSDFQHDI
jgi:hypothetical protein